MAARDWLARTIAELDSVVVDDTREDPNPASISIRDLDRLGGVRPLGEYAPLWRFDNWTLYRPINKANRACLLL